MGSKSEQGFTARLLVALISGYRYVLSPLFPPACRFYPTCSAYTVEAIKKYGALRGIGKGIWRILRCHPFSRGGYDPA
ncbi:MAG: membrane protein insertion efficiency factor YidD [Desulfofustis sp.]|nr:membrane protein insertion efficiency factor YidD [Desulfofustis sp.]